MIVYVVAGYKLGDQAGRALMALRPLCGPLSCGICWWERFSAVLHEVLRLDKDILIVSSKYGM